MWYKTRTCSTKRVRHRRVRQNVFEKKHVSTKRVRQNANDTHMLDTNMFHKTCSITIYNSGVYRLFGKKGMFIVYTFCICIQFVYFVQVMINSRKLAVLASRMNTAFISDGI